MTDSSNNPIPYVHVNFSGAGLAFSSSSVVTGANGQASVIATPNSVGALTATATIDGSSDAVRNVRFVSKRSRVSPNASNSNDMVTFTLTASAAPLVVTATSESVLHNQPIPVLAYTVTGFVNGDTRSVLNGAPVENTNAVQGSVAGPYPIVISQGTHAAANYTLQFVSGTLTVLGISETLIPTLTATTATIDVFGLGFSVPSGQLTFTHTTSGKSVVAPVTLDPSNAVTSFTPQVTTSTGSNSLPVWTTLADVNGDGKLDLVTSVYETDSVQVQLGNGDGTFQPAAAILISSGFGPAENHLVSLRGNSMLDLIVGSFNTNKITVLLGNGDGTFASPAFTQQVQPSIRLLP